MFRRLIAALALLCLPALAIAADVPYTGNLFESGTPVNGTRTISLAVYNVASGGSALHTQAAPLDVSNGVFHTVLVVPDGTWFGGDRWIGVSVNGGPELSPRVKYYAPPRPPNQLIELSSLFNLVSSTTWVKLDSLVINSVAGGNAILTHVGSATWQGAGAFSDVFPVVMAIGPTSPATHDAYCRPAYNGTTDAINFTVFQSVNPGSNTMYLWARVANLPYAISTQRFQALYLPN